MKKICRVLCALFLAACALHAADKEDEESPIGDFLPTFDDLIQYVPKFTVRLGFRGMVGPKAVFSGSGSLLSAGWIAGQLGESGDYEYHDGYVRPSLQRLQGPGQFSDPVPPGTTNSWQFTDLSQLGAVGLANFVTMHAYSLSSADTSDHEKKSGAAFGVELSGEREFGKLFGTKASWGIIAGMSVNQIATNMTLDVAGELTTRTDSFQLGDSTGRNSGVPTAPTTFPVSSGVADISTLLQTDRAGSSTATVAAAMTNFWKLRGAYLTLRAGPTVHIPVTEHISASMSVGALLLYVGTDYQVTQTFKPETGDEMTSFWTDGASSILPGYYADATVQYDMTDNAGLYMGGVFQSAGTYRQEIKSIDGAISGTMDYTAKIDFRSMQGMRAGFLFRF